MFGSFIGNVAGISYFLAFQILGILLALYLFQKEKRNNAFIRQRIRQFCPSLAAYHLRLFLSIFRKSTFICFYYFCRDYLGCVSFWQRTHAI